MEQSFGDSSLSASLLRPLGRDASFTRKTCFGNDYSSFTLGSTPTSSLDSTTCLNFRKFWNEKQSCWQSTMTIIYNPFLHFVNVSINLAMMTSSRCIFGHRLSRTSSVSIFALFCLRRITDLGFFLSVLLIRVLYSFTSQICFLFRSGLLMMCRWKLEFGTADWTLFFFFLTLSML